MMLCKVAGFFGNKKNWSDNSHIQKEGIKGNKDSRNYKSPDYDRLKKALFISLNFMHWFVDTNNGAGLSLRIVKRHRRGNVAAAFFIRKKAVAFSLLNNVAKLFYIICCFLFQRLSEAQLINFTFYFLVIYCIKNINTIGII